MPSETNNVVVVDSSPTCHSWFLYVYSFVSIVLAAGLVYGWPSLRRNLVNEEGSDLDEDALGAVFLAGAWSTQGGRFFFGLTRDYWLGTRYTTCLGLLCVTGGCCGIAVANANNGIALGVSMFFVGLGSSVQLCLQPVAGLFPKQMQGCLLASTSGAFQISGLVFLVLTAISTDRSKTFGAFTGVLALLLLVSAVVLPRDKFEPRKRNLDGIDDLILTEENNSEDGFVENENNERAKEPGVAHGSSDSICSKGMDIDGSSSSPTLDEMDSQTERADNALKSPTSVEQLKSLEYILLLTWFSVLLIPLQYYIATIGYQLEEKGDDSGVYTGIFSITYASAAANAPLLGKIADHAGLGVAQAIATVTVAISFVTLVGPGLNVQIFGMSCYGIGRMMVFGMFFTNVGKRFGYEHYGTLAGLGLFFSAAISLVQYPLITLAASGKETAVNIACAIALLCTVPYCFWLFQKEKREWENDSKKETRNDDIVGASNHHDGESSSVQQEEDQENLITVSTRNQHFHTSL